MTDVETLAERLRAVERAVTDGETAFPEVTDLGEYEERADALEDQVDDLADRTADLEAATQALRGYVGNVRAVNEDVESRANAALAAVDRLEARLDESAHSERPADDAQSWDRNTTTERTGETAHEATESNPGCSRQPAGVGVNTDFAAITDGGDSEGDDEPSPGVLERIRERL
ncbi:DUF7310 family coiled-coil domain-containing protein [Haloarcula salina]|uniref:DUF7310 family coiled-coil domain-containing protein n=1 Tax=Haloarcula salina TaxID=1429914 RepID=UPI003C6F65BE